MAFFKEELVKVKAFVFDVDGVLSTESNIINEEGEMLRNANTKDGYAIQYAIKKGFPVAIITGGVSKGVEIRYRNLGVTDIYMGSKDKVADFNDFISKNNIKAEQVMYMGDDLPDYEVMLKVGLPVCPKNSVEEIKAISAYVSDLEGGRGCVRDVMEQVLKIHGKWMDTKSNIQSV